jgi:hypothetical protein
MSLDGLRAWIGEVERKLGARTRVFLVLLAIAIGASGAAIYLALEAEDSGGGGSGTASTQEVQELREQFEVEGGASEISSLESQIVELRTEVEGLKAKEAAKQGEGESSGESESGTQGGSAGAGGESGAEKLPETGVGKIPESEAK